MFGFARFSALLLLLTGIAMTVPAGAQTDPAAVIADADAGSLERSTNGEHTAKVFLINTMTHTITLQPTAVGDDDCRFKESAITLPPAVRSQVSLTLRPSCDTTKNVTIRFSATSGAQGSIEVTAKAPASPTEPDWNILARASAFAIGAALLALALILIVIVKLNEEQGGWVAFFARLQGALEKRARLDAARTMTGLGPSTAPIVVPARPDISWGAELSGLGTTWSFKESWVSNVTLGASAIVGVIAATDVLNAILGDDAKAVISLVAVVAAIAAVLVTLGPLVVKAFGQETGVATVGGTITAAVVVLLGTYFQVAALTMQGALLVDDDGIRTAIVLGGIAIALVVLLYAVRSVRGILKTGLKPAEVKISDAERAAWIAFRAADPAVPLPPLTPLDVAEILKADGTPIPLAVAAAAAPMRALADSTVYGNPPTALI